MAIQKLRNYDNGTLYPNTQIDALLDADGSERALSVRTGLRDNVHVEVTGGDIAEGMQVITRERRTRTE